MYVKIAFRWCVFVVFYGIYLLFSTSVQLQGMPVLLLMFCWNLPAPSTLFFFAFDYHQYSERNSPTLGFQISDPWFQVLLGSSGNYLTDIFMLIDF